MLKILKDILTLRCVVNLVSNSLFAELTSGLLNKTETTRTGEISVF